MVIMVNHSLAVVDLLFLRNKRLHNDYFLETLFVCQVSFLRCNTDYAKEEQLLQLLRGVLHHHYPNQEVQKALVEYLAEVFSRFEYSFHYLEKEKIFFVKKHFLEFRIKAMYACIKQHNLFMNFFIK